MSAILPATPMSTFDSKRLSGFIRKPILTRTALGLVLFFVLYGLFGYFALPGIVKAQAEKLIVEKLHRQASIGKIEISPYALRMTVRDLKVMAPQGDAVFASFEALTVDLSSKSLWRLAPVVQAVRLTKPYVHLVRSDAHHYNIDDILALGADQPPSPEPARFSIYNIEVEGGRIAFDDRPAGASHTVADLKLGVPFISSLHSQEDVFVKPLLSATVNGTPLLINGEVLPFADSRVATVKLNLDGMDLTRYLEYLPFKPGFKMHSARLDLDLTASFQQPPDQAPSLTLSGTAALKSLQLTEPNGKPILKLAELGAILDRAHPLGPHFEVATLTLNGLEASVTRDRAGLLSLQRLMGPPRAGPASAAPNEPVPAAAPAAAVVKPAAVAPSFALGELVIRGAVLRYTDEQAASPKHASVEKFDATLRKLTLDTAGKRVNIGEVASNSANFVLRQDKPSAASASAATTVATVATAAAASDKVATIRSPAAQQAAPYVVSVGRIALDNWATRLEDRSQARPAVTVLAPISLLMTGLSSAPAARAQLELKAAVNRGGQLAVSGALGFAPIHADLRLDLKAVDILPLQPLVAERVNLMFTGASLSGKGTLQLDQASDGALKGGFKGDATLGNLAAVDKLSGSDFLRWKSLFFGGVDMRLQPFSLAVDQIALSDFFARVIIDPSGRINLQDIARGNATEQKSLTERAAGSAVATIAGAPANLAAAAPANAAAASIVPVAPIAPIAPDSSAAPPLPSALAAPAANRAPIKVRTLTLQGGRVRFTDNFIKPNYTANLMDLGGVVAGLSSDPATSASVDVRGQVNSAPLSVKGRINPLKGDLSLDLQAKVNDMELAPLSPYSGRYVGYGIDKGKLSFEVAYQIENRKLTAQNRLVLDQLTFGEKIDSPGAASLPVHLAVALLRDRNGVIDINLPIAGSLDDPQFSMGGIIVKVIVNLITKAVTAPFALLGSLFGGGEELSYLEFDAGRSAILPAGDAKLNTLAKALVERPALKLDITARTGSEAEREGLKRAMLDRKLRAQKLKDLQARGEAAPAGGVRVSAQEYPALLGRVYKAEDFSKPRNLIGLQKDLPVAEMEKLMMANITLGDDALLALGNQRAQAVKDWLVKNGQVPGERIFILATKPAAPQAKDGASGPSLSRVNFSLK